MLHKGIYNFKSIWKVQMEALISNFTNRLNDIGPTGKFTKIRLKDAQILNWKSSNIIKTQTSNDFSTRGNFQVQALALTHDIGITYQEKDLLDTFK